MCLQLAFICHRAFFELGICQEDMWAAVKAKIKGHPFGQAYLDADMGLQFKILGEYKEVSTADRRL